MKLDTMMEAIEVLARERGVAVDAILDDRPERPGVKFADSELVGIPFRVTIGPRGVESGTAEFTRRAGLETTEISLDSIVNEVVAAVESGRSALNHD